MLIASVMENEPRPLHVMSGDASLNTSLETVTLEAIDTHIAHDGFVPVQLGIEISERLGLPTSGYYYHFMDEALLHEYKIVDGDTTWGFQVTESTSSGLSDVLLSENVVSSCILLPWRVADAPVGPQHLFHSEFKLTQKEFDAIDGAWLAKNATLLDLDAIIAVGEQQFFEAASHCGEGHIHTVIKHDTLSEIAYDRGYRLDDVLDLNPDYKVGERRHTIYPGERIILATPELADDPSRSLEKAEYYKVAQASTLNEVASQAGIPLATLLELNPFLNSLTPEEKVMAGDVVIVKTTEETVTGPREHTVKETQDPLGHESLGTIASTYNVPAAQIAKINGLNTSDPFFSLYEKRLRCY
nr:LysM peptidoglycan-binding domain-containing protein [Vibrio sp. Of7-15]